METTPRNESYEYEYVYFSAGDRLLKRMPHSEVCVHMKVAGRPTWCNIVGTDEQPVVQLTTAAGMPIGGPITMGEAGFNRTDTGWWWRTPRHDVLMVQGTRPQHPLALVANFLSHIIEHDYDEVALSELDLARELVDTLAESGYPLICPQLSGTVIHGTLRNEDLVPAFLAELVRLDPVRGEATQRRIDAETAGVNDDPDGLNPILDEWVMTLIDYLNEYAPEGVMFGTHEGDASDFGWWPVEDEEPRGPGPITLLDVVVAMFGEKDGYTAADFEAAGVAIYAGCQECAASLGGYNAYPSKTGYTRCDECIGDLGFDSVEEFKAWERAHAG